MASKLITSKTKENTRVVFQRDQISAVEEILGSARTEPYIKVYAGGYSFNLTEDFDEFAKKIEEDGE